MSEHTKGPWEATSDESEPLIIAGSTTIAMCFDITGDEQKANALLLAAAPDLLEACKIAICDMPEHNPQYPPFESFTECPAGHKYECGACDNRRIVQAAIAKAEPS